MPIRIKCIAKCWIEYISRWSTPPLSSIQYEKFIEFVFFSVALISSVTIELKKIRLCGINLPREKSNEKSTLKSISISKITNVQRMNARGQFLFRIISNEKWNRVKIANVSNAVENLLQSHGSERWTCYTGFWNQNQKVKCSKVFHGLIHFHLLERRGAKLQYLYFCVEKSFENL